MFVPKIAVRIFPIKKTALWKSFVAKTIADKKIDPKAFWEFREFYCPGYFRFNRNASSSPFLEYNCDALKSSDSFTLQNTIAPFLQEQPQDIIFQNDSSIIFQKQNTAFIIFILPVEEMEKANGFFDYKEKDKELVKGKFWVNITSVTLNK